MAANRRVSDKDLIASLRKWEGNVAAVSDEVGIARNNVYERVSQLGLSANDFRRKHNSTYQDAKGDGPKGDGATNRGTVVRFAGATTRQPASSPTLGGMTTASGDEIERKAGPIRLRPDQIKQLREAKFDFMAKHRTEATEADLLQKFFDDLFPDFLKRALSREKAKA